MILKKFLGKTIEAAKKSALQMYGDDFVVLDSNTSDNNKKAGITVAVDRKQNQNSNRQQRSSETAERNRNGVSFKRSNGSAGEKKNQVSHNLLALRKYAEQQPAESSDNGQDKSIQFPKNKKSSTNGTSFTPLHKNGEEEANHNGEQVYSRASIQNGAKKNGTATNGRRHSNNGTAGTETHQTENNEEFPETDLLSRFDQAAPKIKETKKPSTSSSAETRREQREITALHKRFDKLEALLDSALISSNLDYASHPAFQQLVHTGINTSVVAGWFSEIIREGIDPYDQTQMFMSKLSGLIRDALGTEPASETQKYLMFTGPSGSGKTRLVMKLLLHPDFMQNKHVAVVSLLPQAEQNPFYYTTLEPFCTDHDIPWFEVRSGMEVTQLQERWEKFDHVLIDTPSISTQQDNSFRQYWKIRQVFASLAPLEVHYVVNASLNRFYFQNSSAAHHPLQPDYVAVTHLDEVSQWGPIIPFLKEMGCSARYISTGNAIPDSLQTFNPTWFAQNVLQN